MAKPHPAGEAIIASAKAEIETLRSAGRKGDVMWQPISTVPKDGTLVLVGRFIPGCEHDGFMAVDRWSRPEDKRGWVGFGRFNEYYWPATHWTHLPPRPKKTPPTPIEEVEHGREFPFVSHP